VQLFWWSGSPDWWWSDEARDDSVGGLPWWIALLWGISLIGLGVLIVIEPHMLAMMFAAGLIAFGALVAASASVTGWRTRRRRPRRIRVRVA
jgi:hypothetical protein